MNLIYYKLSDTPSDISLLTEFLLKTENSFRIPLSTKYDLKEYAEKILANGHVISFCDATTREIISCRGFYANDTKDFTAYGSMMCSMPKAQGLGLAKKLVIKMFEICRDLNMKYVISRSVNPIAIHLYRSVGYQEIKIDTIDDIEEITFRYQL
ncbi:MAG: GNAT family N-acetyltransferase [Muribaculaceae bacterium]|nr:GNAT family N-acetyltransferase [Muribaculaceae bacterium]